MLFTGATALLILFALLIVIRRRYFHPLSHVPGPFLWSVSSFPVLYHQGIEEGQLMHILPALHEQYGPVVRIGPNEVHLSNPSNYDKVYSVGYKFSKDPDFYGPMEGPLKTPIILTILSAKEHQIRRSYLNPFFSRRSVLDMEHVVRDKTGKLLHLLKSSLVSAGVFDAHHAIRAFSVDVITEYAYARCWNQMDQGDWGAGYQLAIQDVQLFFPWLQTFPFLVPLFGLIPDWVNTMVFPPFKKWYDSLTIVRAAVTEVRKEISLGIKPARRTIFHELMDPAPLDAPEFGSKTREPLSDLSIFADAVNVTGAGAETTGSTAGRGIFEVLSNPEVHLKLSGELVNAFPNPEDIDLLSLEKLPYLRGVIKEALRLNPGLPGHLPRVVPSSGATFDDVALPPGTVVSMSAWLMHHDAAIFGPDPTTFDPERWVNESNMKEVEDRIWAQEKCLVAFGRGSRNCLGQAVAMCELFYTIGTVFRHFPPGSIDVHPEFSREDLQLTELLLGYHPRKARKFKIVSGRNLAVVN
ncbi:cytochrome P450 [Cercophora newfieldiana]|uniref:Cytochrome P450 n=1 Tax=Cercophora newfieldiana TaxID=92897 RepID=A0AA40CXV3_9PEZI|nr:cytochrome P450 [Cercophora newfieldiana]